MHKTYLAFHLAAVVATGIFTVPVQAFADAGLYDAPIPVDKSLIRFVNVKLRSGVTLDFSGQKFSVEPVALSNYKMIGNGTYDLSDGQTSAKAAFQPGKFYTIAVGAAEGLVVIQDKDVENPSKSSLSIYNFSSTPTDLALRLKGESKALFKDVAPASMASKELPVIDIGLSISKGEKTVKDVDKVSLTAKERQNVVVVDSQNGPVSYVISTGIDK
jgi:hypothetical protein